MQLNDIDVRGSYHGSPKEALNNTKSSLAVGSKPTPAATPKEITQMKVANPLNPTKFRTLFKKSRPSMQLDAKQQKKELIQETIANNSSSEGQQDYEFQND